LNISEAAKYFGLTAVTLRYYERVGIIPPERKQLLIEERNILLQKYNEMGTMLNRLNQKIQDYEDGKFVTPEQTTE
jgi:hypothetical protein